MMFYIDVGMVGKRHGFSFVKNCLSLFKKKYQVDYQYGGTWKSKKK